MKNKTLILSLLLITFGCNAPYHVKKARKHTQKALEKGVVIPKDTITLNTTDTITAILTYNDTTFITKTVTNTVTLEPTVEIQTRWQTKYKFKEVKVTNNAMIDSLKQVVKIERQKTKQTTKKSKWWLWFLIGFISAFALNIYLGIKGIVKRLNK